jgi:hypothetical protein
MYPMFAALLLPERFIPLPVGGRLRFSRAGTPEAGGGGSAPSFVVPGDCAFTDLLSHEHEGSTIPELLANLVTAYDARLEVKQVCCLRSMMDPWPEAPSIDDPLPQESEELLRTLESSTRSYS